MANLTSTLDIVLQDDVTKTAVNVEASLAKMEARAKAVDHALAQGGASDKLSAGLRKLGASVPHIEAATKAVQQFAAAEGMAADRGQWTTKQAQAMRNFESVTVSSVRAIMGAERALAESEAKTTAAFTAAQAKRAHAAEQASHRITQAHGRGGHGDTSTISGIASLYAASTFEHMAEGVLHRYQEFDDQRRYARAVMGLTDKQQEPLVQQALRGGSTSRFNDIQWLEAQREFAARGYKTDQVLAFTGVAATLGTAMNKTLPESVKLIEGAMLGFGKDTSTFDKAVKAARQTADLQVKASKVSGMDAEDIMQLYKYGAAPAKMAGLSEQSLLAYGAVSKKSNIGGDEAGTAFRAMAKNLVSPTAGALVAMRAAGIDYNKFQRAPTAMDTGGFTSLVAQKYGVKLTAGVQAGLGKIFANPQLLGDPAKFAPAVVGFLRGALGGKDAKSLKSIAGLATSYRNASAGGVNANGLMEALITAMSKNSNLANAVFGGKAGGKIFAALGDPHVFGEILDLIKSHSEGFAQNVAEQRNEGYNGAVLQLQGAVATLESSIGRAFDGGGNGGFLTNLAQGAAEAVRGLAELPAPAQRAATEFGAAAAGLAALKGFDILKGGFGLNTAASALEASAAALDGAAGRIGVAALEHGLPGVIPGGKLAGAAERGLAAEAIEIAATGVTLSAGTVAFAGVAAVAIIDALSHGPKKPQASDRPGFADKFAAGRTLADLLPGGRDGPPLPPAGHPRGSVRSQKDTDRPGHYVIGRGGVREYVEDRAARADGFFAGALDANGRPLSMPGRGFYPTGRAHIGPDVPLVNATPFADAMPPPGGVTVPDPIPMGRGTSGIENRTFGNYLRFARPEAAAGTMPQTSQPIAPSVDTSGLDAAKAKAGEAHAALDGLNMTVSPNVSMAMLDAFIAKIGEARAQLAALGSIGPGANASISPRRLFAAVPMGHTTM